MGNPIIEAPIPLAGNGFIAKRNGNFQPGEYKRLNNAEINADGYLVNRRNVYNVNGENTGSAVTPLVNPQRFIGNMDKYSIISCGRTQYLVGDSTFLQLWSLPADSGSSYSQFLGFFRYNNKNFWLAFEFNSAVDIRLVLYHDVDIPVPDIPETYGSSYFASLTKTTILTFLPDTTDFYEFQFKNFFIYKERLWIATSVVLYFSMATNPLVFAAPDGGFFKHPGNRINYALAIKDQIYTLCEDSVYALSYNTDPNLDSTERPLSDSIGGEMGCIHLDTVYFINNLGIYVINGNNVDKVMDSRFDVGKDFYNNHIYSFEDYLVVNKYSPVNYDNNYSPPARVTARRNLIIGGESDTTGGTQILTGWANSGSGPVELRKNWQPNPNLNLDPNDSDPLDYFKSITPASDMDIGHSNLASHAYEGTWGGVINRTTSTGTLTIGTNSFLINVLPNEDWIVSLRVMSPLSRTVRLELAFKNSSQTVISTMTSDFDVVGDTWTRISKTGKAPANAAYLTWTLKFLNVSGVSKHAWDTVLVEKASSLKSYFDGSYSGDTFRTYGWTGLADKSPSTLSVNTAAIDDNPFTVVDGISPGKVLRFGGTFADPAYLEGVVATASGTCTKTFTPTTAPVTGVPYTFRFDHKRGGTAIGGTLHLTLQYLDTSNVVKGTSDYDISTDYNTSAAYQTYLLSNVVFPVGAVKLKVAITYSKVLSGYTGETSFFVDLNKFHLEKTSTYSGYFTGNTTDTADVTYSWVGTPFDSESTTGSATSHSYLKNNGYKFEPYQGNNELGYNTYFINTLNGSVHVLDFVDQYTEFSTGKCGFLVDAFMNPFGDESGNTKIFFLTNKLQTDTPSGQTYNSFVYFMSSSDNIEVQDFAVDSNLILRRRAPKIDVEIDSYVPDGNEHRIKKFRSIMLQALLPPTGMQLEFSYDNSNTWQTAPLEQDSSSLPQSRPPYALRVGLNQRARSITIRFRNPNWLTELLGSYGALEVADTRVLWTYSSRLATNRGIGS